MKSTDNNLASIQSSLSASATPAPTTAGQRNKGDLTKKSATIFSQQTTSHLGASHAAKKGQDESIYIELMSKIEIKQ